MRWWQNQGLNFKAALGIAITMVVVLGFIFVALSQYFRSLLWQSEIQKTENINAVAEILMIDAMMAGRKDEIQVALDKLGQNVSNEQLYSIALYDDQYVLTSFATGFPGSPIVRQDSMPDNVDDPSCWGCHQLPPGERPTHLVVTVDGREVIRNSVPLYNEERCQSCHGTGKMVLGDIMVDFSQEQFNQGYTTTLIGLGVGLLIAILLVAYVLYQVLRRIVLNPVGELVEAADAVSHGALERKVKVRGGDEIGILARAFNSMVAQLRDLIGTLEQRVADRTKALVTSAEVSRQISTIMNPSQLVIEVVERLQASFNYYHAHIYLFDESQESLVLVGGTGEVGRTMLERGHKIPRGRGLVGRAADLKEAILVPETEKDPNWLPNPLLPDTKAEVAVPIIAADHVLGVLDVQNNVANSLTNQDAELISSIANQVGIAMQNIRQFEQTEKMARELGVVASVSTATSTITETSRLLQEVVDMTKRAFSLYHAHVYMLNQAGDTLELVAGAGEVGKQMVSEGRRILLTSEQSLVARAARTRQGVVVNDVRAVPDFLPHPLLPDTRSEMSVPMIVGDDVIGVLDVQSDQVNRFTEVDVNIETTLAAQIAVAVQNARTFEQTQRQAELESLLNAIGQRIQRTTTVESALQVAAVELGNALGKHQTLVTLNQGFAGES